MNFNSSNKFYINTLINIIYSTCITILSMLLLLSSLDNILKEEAERSLLRTNTLFVSRNGIVLLFLVLGVILFSSIFISLQNKNLKYIDYIYNSINEISKGDFSKEIEISGDNEFSKMAESLNEMKQKISSIMEKERESEKSKNELITSVAHDLRTPLTSIIGYLDLLRSAKEIDEETKNSYMEIIYKKSKRLQKLTEDLFDFTKLNHGKIAMKIKEFDLVSLLSQIVDSFYPMFESNKLNFNLTSNVNKIILKGDINLIVRLFDNLINNAIKYGTDGKKIDIKIVLEKDIAKVMISNYGKVIPESEIPFLFEKFYRIESSRSSNTGGTGLGLAIVKNIIEIHKAKIEVVSNENKTSFIVSFDTKEKLEEDIF